jgi:hypothetical protein
VEVFKGGHGTSKRTEHNFGGQKRKGIFQVKETA